METFSPTPRSTTGGPATKSWLEPRTITEKCEVTTRTAPKPATENLFDTLGYQRLPTSPPEGLDALVADAELTAALGPVFVTTFADVLRLDWQRYLSHVSDWEITEYREIL